MYVAGVVAEYNPFHKGHFYHLMETRKRGATHIVAVMSGWFVQRGDVALVDPFQRAAMAIDGGADLVLGLPVAYSLAPAERFAMGAIGTLALLNCVNCLSFGSEIGNGDMIRYAAQVTEDMQNHPELLERMNGGKPYPQALEETIASKYSGVSAMLRSPNDVLGMEYVKAMTRQSLKWDIMAIKRKGAGHDMVSDPNSGVLASASMVRSLIKDAGEWQNLVPETTFKRLNSAIQRNQLGSMERLERPILAALRSLSSEQLGLLPEVSGGTGLEGRMSEIIGRYPSNMPLSRSMESWSLDRYLGILKTRRHPMARIRRCTLAALLGMATHDYSRLSFEPPPYAWILGMNRKGQELLYAKSAEFRGFSDDEEMHLRISHSLRQLSKNRFGGSKPNLSEKFAELEARSADIWGLSTEDIMPPGLAFKNQVYVDKK